MPTELRRDCCKVARRLQGWAGLVLLMGVGGCVSLAPPVTAPDPMLGARYDAVSDAALPELGASARAAVLPWRQVITDEATRRRIDLALKNSRDLRLAVLRVSEAQAAYGVRKAEEWPLVAAGAQAARTRVPSALSPTGQALQDNFFRAGMGFSDWELDLWGRVRGLKTAALQEFLASDAARRGITLSLIAQVADASFALQELDERIALARRAEVTRAESLRIFRRRVEEGATSRLELTQVELLWQQARTLVTQLELARANQLHALALLMGDPGTSSITESPGILNMGAIADVPAGLPSDLLTDRPDVMAAEHAIKAANAQVGVARAAYFPRIALTAVGGVASGDLSGLFQESHRGWALAPNITLPLLDAGRRSAAVDVARVREQEAVARYEKTVQNAFREVSDALSARHWLAEQAEAMDAMHAAQAERARLAHLRYDAGSARYLEVLDAERDLLTLEQQQKQVRRALLSARLGLYVALGGGVLDGQNAIPPTTH